MVVVGKKLKASNIIVEGIMRKGKNLVEVSVASYQIANNLVEKQECLLPEKWKAHIPDLRLSRIGVARNVESSLSDEEILENL